MPRLPWIFVAIGLCVLAILQPAILLPLLIPGVVLLSALRDFLPAEVLYSTYSGIDLALGVIVLFSAFFWLMLTLMIRWRPDGPFVSFLVRLTGTRIGLIAATLNVLVFVALLVAREPDYGRLAELDAGKVQHTSAEPMYLAGRPFYSAAHYDDVALTETLFFTANLPADLGALLVVQAVDEAQAYSMSSAQRSWVTAVCLMLLAALWAFLVAAMGHRFVRWARRDQPGDPKRGTTAAASQ